jgi:hypothetical protein
MKKIINICKVAAASLALLISASHVASAAESGERQALLEPPINNYHKILEEIEALTARIHAEVDQVLAAYRRDTAEYHRRMGIRQRTTTMTSLTEDLAEVAPKHEEQTLNLDLGETEEKLQAASRRENMDPILLKTIESIEQLYNDVENEGGWIMVKDSQDPKPIVASGSIGLENSNPWKIHISIDPDRLREAIEIVVPHLLSPQAPKNGFKILHLPMFIKNKMDYQASKQIALLFPDESYHKKNQIKTFLEGIANDLRKAKINPDPRAINSDQTDGNILKWDGTIMFDDRTPSPFHYRNEDFIVMEDKTYKEMVGTLLSNYTINGNAFFVKQSYFNRISPDDRITLEGAVQCPLQGMELHISH